MNQNEAPILEALEQVLERPIAGFGGPGHHMGRGASEDILALVGKQAFRADVLTPKGLDDRVESAGVMSRAWSLAAEAWGAAVCRFSTGGSTQGVQTALNIFAGPGDTVLIANNAHKAEHLTAVLCGLDVRPLDIVHDRAARLEHGVDPGKLGSALDRLPGCKAVLVVSPTFYGVTSDIAALSKVCESRSVPLIVDAAWGGAFAFCSNLPMDPIAQGADIAVCSVHKTMGGLAQAAIVLGGPKVDAERFALAFDLLQSTSPSVPLFASIDALRRRHALHGERVWNEVLEKVRRARTEIAAIGGLKVLGKADLVGGPGAADFDETKLLIDVSALGATGYQVDGWLANEHRVSVVLSDIRYVMAVFSVGTSDSDVDRLIAGLRALPSAVKAHENWFHPPAVDVPGYADLGIDLVVAPASAFHGPTENVRFEDADGRIAAEIVAPTPPEIPRLRPGQRVTSSHVAFLVAEKNAGAFISDPAGHGEGYIRVVAAD